MKRVKGIALGTVALISVAVAGAACSGGKSSNGIKIGSILSLTGDYAAVGADEVDAINLAFDEINAGGGVLGKNLQLVNRDDGTDATRAPGAAQSLAAAGVGAVIGGISSSVTLAAAAVTSPAQIVQISASGTSPSITTFADGGYLFRTCPSDALQGRLLAQRAHAHVPDFTNVAVIHTTDAYGQGLADAFAATFTSTSGSTVKSISYPDAPTTAIVTAVLNSAFAVAPQAVVLISVPSEGVQFITKFLTGGYPSSTFWYFTDSVEDQQNFVQATITAGGNFTFPHEGSGPSTPSTTTYVDFDTRFNAKYGRHPGPGNYDANAYDAAYLIAMAIEQGGASDGPTIKANLLAVSTGGTAVAPGNWTSVKAMLDAGTDVNFEGAAGNENFDANGDVIAAYDIWKVQGSTITTVVSGVNP